MPRIKLRRPRGKRRGPLTAAQKLALKKATEASARARRGTGKDEPSRPRAKAKRDNPGLPELARRSLSSPNTKGPARKLSEYQKTDSAIFKDHGDKLAKLKDDYNSNRITKRQFTLRKNKLDKELREKRDANIKKHGRDKDGNPKSEDVSKFNPSEDSTPYKPSRGRSKHGVSEGTSKPTSSTKSERSNLSTAEQKERDALVKKEIAGTMTPAEGDRLEALERKAKAAKAKPQSTVDPETQRGRKERDAPALKRQESEADKNAALRAKDREAIRAANNKPAAGGAEEHDVKKRSVSGLKKDRQALHAKVKDGTASDEDKARLKDVQLELKTRGLNRQKDASAQKPSAEKKPDTYKSKPRAPEKIGPAAPKINTPRKYKASKEEQRAQQQRLKKRLSKAQELELLEGGKDPGKYRQSATPTTKSDPKVKAEIFRENQGTQIRGDIDEARRIAKNVIARDNVVAQLDTASNSQQLIDAYKGILHYLDEAKQHGPLSASEKQAYERISNAIGRINMKYGRR